MAKKVTMQCNKTKALTEAWYPCKITKTNHFYSVLVTSIHETDPILNGFQKDSHIFQMLALVRKIFKTRLNNLS